MAGPFGQFMPTTVGQMPQPVSGQGGDPNNPNIYGTSLANALTQQAQFYTEKANKKKKPSTGAGVQIPGGTAAPGGPGGPPITAGGPPAVNPGAVEPQQSEAGAAMASLGAMGGGGGAQMMQPQMGAALRSLGRRIYPQESSALAGMGRIY